MLRFCFFGSALAFGVLAGSALASDASPSSLRFDPDQCRVQEGLPGPEDFDIERSEGGDVTLYVSSQQRRDGDNGLISPKEPGQIFMLNLTGDAWQGPVPMPIVGRDNQPFHPHGIARFTEQGRPFLLIVNHFDENESAIELYAVADQVLHFQQRFVSPLLVSPNDLVAVSTHEFYVTNDHGSKGVWKFLEDLFGRSGAHVLHFKEGSWQIAVPHIAYANGIALNKAGTRLYVASTLDRGLFEYTRDPASGHIDANGIFHDAASGLDNLLWENERYLTTTGHPSPWAFIAHAQSAKNLSPSEAFRFDTETGTFEKIFADAGQHLSAASTALLTDQRLVLSGVYDTKMLLCPRL